MHQPGCSRVGFRCVRHGVRQEAFLANKNADRKRLKGSGGWNPPRINRRPHTYSVPSFHEWLERRAREASAAEMLATLVARSAAGMSRDDLARALRLPPETLDDLLRALAATGQVVMLNVGGRTVYRAAG
jgi:hypothetical protein